MEEESLIITVIIFWKCIFRIFGLVIIDSTDVCCIDCFSNNRSHIYGLISQTKKVEQYNVHFICVLTVYCTLKPAQHGSLSNDDVFTTPHREIDFHLIIQSEYTKQQYVVPSTHWMYKEAVKLIKGYSISDFISL